MLRWLVSALFLALPIGTTIGILLGLQAYRHANGQPPPFSGGDDGNGLPGIGTPKGKDQILMKCDTTDPFFPQFKGETYVLNGNPWGWKKGETGALCMQVEVNGNGTYATEFTAPPFNVTWSYPAATGGGNNVHAFPNAEVKSKSFPAKIGSISKLEFDVEWYFSQKNDTKSQIAMGDVDPQGINANVAIDMFMDKDTKTAADGEKASYEIMVWFAAFGAATWPIGKSATAANHGRVTSKTVQNVEFELYAGKNSKDQVVLSWVATDAATKPITTFKGDLKPLLDEIFAQNNPAYPQKTDYLGYLAFGQEAYSSPNGNVTFSVPSLAVDVEAS